VAFGRSRNAVSIAFEGEDKVSPVVRGIKSSMDSLQKDAKQGFGLAAGFNVASFAMGKVTDALGAVVNFGGRAVEKASELEEANSKVNAVFEDGAEIVLKWAKTTTDAFGISELAASRAAGDFGNLFKAMGSGLEDASNMSRALVELASDLASFNDTGIQDVLTALRSGLVGEAEPMRRFGVSISAARVEAQALAMGLAETKAELTDADKLMARYEVILQDTATAQGDFARTSDGLANSQRKLDAEVEDLEARLGMGLLPTAKNLTQAKRDLLSVFNSIIGIEKPLSNAYKQYTRLTGGLGDAARKTTSDLEELGVRGFGTLEDFSSEFSEAINSGALEIRQLFTGEKLFRGVDLGELYRKASPDGNFFDFRALVRGVKDDAGNNINKFAPEVIRFLNQTWVTATDKEAERHSNITLPAAPGMEELGRHTASMFFGHYGNAIAVAMSSPSGKVGGINGSDVLAGKMPGIMESANEWLVGLFSVDRGKNFSKSIRKQLKASMRLERNKVRDLIKDPKLLGWIGEQYENQREWLAGKADKVAGKKNPLAALFIGGAIDASEVNTKGVNAAAVTAAIAFGSGLNAGLRESAGAYIAKLLKGETVTLAPDVKVHVAFTGATQALDWLLRNAPNGTNIHVSGSVPRVERTGGRAGGGPVSAGATYLVGEQGPELLTLGSKHGNVTPNHELGGSGGDVYLDGRLVGQILDQRLGGRYGGTRGSY